VAEDAEALHAIQSREDVTRWLYWGPRTLEQVREVLDGLIARPAAAGPWFAVERRDAPGLIGSVSLQLGEHRQGEIGFTFDPAHQGHGYATEASRAVLALAFGEYGLHRVFGRLEPRNAASARVLEKLGMRREALLIENEWVKGEWQSEAIYALLDREWAELTSEV
jgi:RimJ/RimL family protein N-acetyltransferase